MRLLKTDIPATGKLESNNSAILEFRNTLSCLIDGVRTKLHCKKLTRLIRKGRVSHEEDMCSKWPCDASTTHLGVTDLDLYPDYRLAMMHYRTEKDHEMEIKGAMNENENMGNIWCLLTDAEGERRLKSEKNPRILFQSVEAQLDSLFKMLVSRGATLDPKEWTEIMNNAITGGHMPMIRAILESHLIVDNGSDVFGEEALEYAARLGTPSVANAMLDLETFSSEISLCRAARMGRLFTTELLLRRGAAVDERNDIGSTPLVQAVMEGHQPIVEMLLEWGAVVDAEDLALWTALETNRSEDVAIAQLLRDRVRQ